jgi:anthranilate phosphoribosyltransferase
MLSISQCGIGYFHAPFFHPLFAKYQALRRQIKIPTVFNLLGPLINPLRLRYQMIGVNSLRTMHLYANVLAKQKMQRAMVCHSRDGMDEISPFAVTDFAWVEHGRVKVGWIEPRSYGFRSKLSANALYGGDPVQNKNITTRLLQGKLAGPLRDIVLLNGGAGLWVCELAKNLKEGISMACDAIDSGKAYAALQQFIALSNESRNRKRP